MRPFPRPRLYTTTERTLSRGRLPPSADGRNLQPDSRRRRRVFPPRHGRAAGAAAVRPWLLALLLRALRDRLRRRAAARRRAGQTPPGEAEEDRPEGPRDRRGQRPSQPPRLLADREGDVLRPHRRDALPEPRRERRLHDVRAPPAGLPHVRPPAPQRR